MRPWAGYVRVSHVGTRRNQRDRFHSPDDQATQITAWARMRREEVVVLPAELDESGGRQDRPILAEAVEGIERGEYRGLVVAYLSRASRSVKHLLELWDRIESAGGEVVAVSENVDTSTPAGRLTRTMLAAIAEHELDLHRERFELLRATATARGLWQRRQTPIGYERDPGSRRLVPSPEAPKLRQAFRDRIAGKAISQIAGELGLTPSGVRAVLRNRVYLGELRVGDHVNPAAHPALVDEDEWLAVQTASNPRPARSGKAISLLAGLARCASCGHVMSRSTKAYICHRHHSAGVCPSPAGITLRLLESHVEEIALSELAKLEATATHSDRAVSEARSALRAAEAEVAAYLEGVTAAGLSPGEYAKGARIRREAVDSERERLAGALARRPGQVEGDPVKVWAGLDATRRNELLRSLLECILVAPAGRGRRVPISDRVRVIAHGAGIARPYKGGGVAIPVRQLALPDRDDPIVLGMDLAKDALEGTSG